ncbi:type IV secretory system conjugative DNA transfer family protein [Roseibacterium beibuensis]|nr:type IV secretory system conjugative DNA transfer family protein [Roseibacterium beibuensis]MCS6627821.1 type IV secretory system conjugative DNA transfer family protein [Roseibacterium beibuensis]
MNNGTNPKGGSPTAALLLGASFYGLAHLWGQYMVAGDAADGLYTGMFKVIGGIAMLGGLGGYYKGWQQREKRKASRETSGTFGDAAFATLEECEDKGLFDPKGLYLGLLNGRPLFYRGKAHLLTCAPARQGKGINIVLPNLLHYQGSVIVTDPKGELAAVTAQHRRERLGQDVAVFNPWGLHGLPQDRINPLENVIAIAGNPALQRGLSDEVKAIVMQLYPEPEDTRNQYFREGSRSIMRAVLMYLALCSPKLCALPEMWRIIANPLRLERMVEAMRKEDVLGGLLADLGDDLAHQMEDNPDLFGDFRAGAVQHLSIFEPGGYLADAVSASDISLADLKSGNVSLYLAFPPDRIVSHGAALGLIVNQAITAVARSSKRGEVLFMLDEFANLGKLAGLAESLTALPGLGVRVWMFVQELAEMVRIYGVNTAKTIQSQAEVRQFFAVNSDELAQALSRALGQKTVKTINFNLGRSDTDEIGESLSETGQPLMRAEDITQLERNQQILLVKGVKVILGELLAVWFFSPWREWLSPNPVEGDYPKKKPRVRFGYELKK